MLTYEFSNISTLKLKIKAICSCFLQNISVGDLQNNASPVIKLQLVLIVHKITTTTASSQNQILAIYRNVPARSSSSSCTASILLQPYDQLPKTNPNLEKKPTKNQSMTMLYRCHQRVMKRVSRPTKKSAKYMIEDIT